MSTDVNMALLRMQQETSNAASQPTSGGVLANVFGLRDINMQAGSLKALSPLGFVDKPMNGAGAQAFTLQGKFGHGKLWDSIMKQVQRELPDLERMVGGFQDNAIQQAQIADQPLQAANISHAELGNLPMQRAEIADAPIQRSGGMAMA